MQPIAHRRTTKQRQIIVEELQNLRYHPTADQLYEIVRKRLPGISLSTVYRNLEILSAEGVIMKMDMAGTQKRFDGTVESHYHIRCVECGRLDDIDMLLACNLDEIARNYCDYSSVTHNLEFSGVCPDCLKRS
ncbi:MAG: transcriptional repressor [Deltaproteobacteria bacterium]|nr:transcriptional repressor [Deltaproteobacteria bacterium]